MCSCALRTHHKKPSAYDGRGRQLGRCALRTAVAAEKSDAFALPHQSILRAAEGSYDILGERLCATANCAERLPLWSKSDMSAFLSDVRFNPNIRRRPTSNAFTALPSLFV